MLLKVWKTTFLGESQLSVATYEMTKVLLYPIHSIDVIYDTFLVCSRYIFFDDFDGLFVLQDVIAAWVTQMKQDLDIYAFQVLPQVLAPDARGFRDGMVQKGETNGSSQGIPRQCL